MLQVSGILAGISTSFMLSRISIQEEEQKGILVMNVKQIRALRAYETFRRFAFSTLLFIFSTLTSLLWMLSTALEVDLLVCISAASSAISLTAGLIIFMSRVGDFLRYELWLK